MIDFPLAGCSQFISRVKHISLIVLCTYKERKSPQAEISQGHQIITAVALHTIISGNGHYNFNEITSVML